MSATAVPLGAARLSDIAFAIGLVFFAVRLRKRQVVVRGTSSSAAKIFILLIVTSVISWGFQLAFGSTQDIEAGLSTAISIPLVLLFGILTLLDFTREQALKFSSQLSTVFCILLFLLLFFYLNFPQPSWLLIDYESTDRFSALSLNPNQTALVLLPIPFFAFFAWREGYKSGYIALIEIVAIMVINLFAFGKALFLAWIVGFVVPAFVELIRKYPKFRTFFILVGVACLPVAIYLLVGVIDSFYSGTARGSVEGQGENRLVLWTNGLLAWKDAWLIGNGPGAFSGLNGPYEQIESHNTLIEWAASYGLVGASFLAALPVIALRAAVRQRDWLAAGFFITLVFQSGFHFYGRQPFFWLWWVIGILLIYNPRVDLRTRRNDMPTKNS